MTRTARALLLILAACGKEPVSTPRAPSYDGPAVLKVTIAHFEGSYQYTVFADRRAVYVSSGSFALAGGAAVETQVTPDELHEVAKVLRANDFCSLVSSGRAGVPDEARPYIDVKLEDLGCSVMMWDNEFADNPRAKASLGAVEALGRNIKARAATPPK